MPQEPRYNATVIIPQLGLSELTERLVDQIRGFESRLEIIAAINDPEESPRIKGCRCVYLREPNLSRSWNLSVSLASTDQIVLLNNDVVCDGKFAVKLSRLTDNGKNIAGIRKRRERLSKSRKILEGWCFAFHRSTWESLQGFDESLELYYADTDFMLRAVSAGIGIKARQLPLKHLGHKTAHNKSLRPDRHRRYIEDEKRFLKKHREAGNGDAE